MFKEYEEARKILYEEIDKDWIDSKIKERRKYLRELQRRHGKYVLFYEKENRCHPFAEWWLDSSLYGIIRIIMLASAPSMNFLPKVIYQHEPILNRSCASMFVKFRIGRETN